MWVYLAIAIGGTLGCWARYAMTNLAQTIYGTDFPYATLSINLLGSFLMGFLFIETVERVTISPALRTGILTGGLGGFTTFSTFEMESLLLTEGGEPLKALLYIGFPWGSASSARSSAPKSQGTCREDRVDDEVMVSRVYISEADHGRRKSLMQEVLNVLHDQQRMQAVVVLRAIAGFGDSGEVHASDILRLNVDLPLVIEFFDRPDAVKGALELLRPLVPAGHILSWTATRHGGPPGRA